MNFPELADHCHELSARTELEGLQVFDAFGQASFQLVTGEQVVGVEIRINASHYKFLALVVQLAQ